MELSNEARQLLSNGIAEIVLNCINTEKVDVIFIDVVRDEKQSKSQIINLSVVYNSWINFKKQRKILDLINPLEKLTEVNIKLDYKFSDDYSLAGLLNCKPLEEKRYYQFCLGEILYINSERFRYLQELSRKNSKQERSTVVDILPIMDIKKRILTKKEGQLEQKVS